MAAGEVVGKLHGRDLFAPVAALLANGGAIPGEKVEVDTVRRPEWPDDLDEIVYIDHYGNAMTGRRAGTVPDSAVMEISGHRIAKARTFSDVGEGVGFWYENSSGLVEFAVNQGRAADRLGLDIGDGFVLSP